MKNRLNCFGKIMQKAMKEQREAFVYSLNHDLRIPAIAQIRALELINRGHFGELSPVQKDMLIQTEQSGRFMLNLISLLINTYNIENQEHKLIYERFNLYELMLSCFEELQEEASEKNITYEYISEDKNFYINADKDAIKKVLINLIYATIMYSGYGEKVSVKVVKKSNKIHLSIFCNRENSQTINADFNAQYTSIGESIRMHFCKKIIEIHKGQILHTINHNAMFEFELPKAIV